MKRQMMIQLCLVIFLGGCSALKFPNINPPNPPQTMYNYEQSFTKNPTAVVVDGKTVVVENQEQNVRINYQKQQEKLSWWKRFTNWLGSLGMIAVVLIIIGIFVAPGATIGFLFNSFRKTKKALRQTVRAIDESKAVNTDNGLKLALLSNQDTDTKRVIDTVKREAQS